MKKYLYLILFFLVCVPAIAGTINSYTLKSPPDDADTIVIYDSDDGSTKKIEVGDISGSGSGINWSSYMDLTSIGNANEFIVNDSGTSKSINWQVLTPEIVSDINWSSITSNIETTGSVTATSFIGGAWTDSGTNLYPTDTTDTVSIGTTTASSTSFEIVKQGSTSPIKISSSVTSAPGNLFVITSGGNVGIGTANPIAVNQQYLFNMYRDDNRLNLITAVNPNTGNIAGAGVELVTADTKSNIRAIPSNNTVAGVAGIGRLWINNEVGSGLSLAVSNSAQDIRMYVSTSEKLRMTGGGNFGIGTNDPVAKLAIVSTNGLAIGTTGSGSYIRTTPPTGGLIIYGNTGIGTYSPLSKLQVDGLIMPKKATADPCTAGQEGGLFYNDTSNYWCGCNGTDDVKLTDNTTSCF